MVTLVGLLLTHVDDLLYASSGPVYDEAMSRLREDFKLKENKERFTFCGKHVFQDKDGSIIVGQADAARAIDFVEILPSRRKLLAARCTSRGVDGDTKSCWSSWLACEADEARLAGGDLDTCTVDIGPAGLTFGGCQQLDQGSAAGR